MKLQPGRGADEGAIVIKVPAELKALADPIRALIASAQEKLKTTRGYHAVDYATIELQVEAATAEIERATHATLLQNLDIDAERVEIGGKLYRRMYRANGEYFTMAGSVTVERTRYREEGQRRAPTVDAVNLRAGTIGNGWLPKTAQAIAHVVQKGTPREAAASAKQTGRLPYAIATFDRVAHRLGEHWLAKHADIEDQLAHDDEISEHSNSISIALDRVSVPMEEPKPRPRGRPRKGAPANPVTRQFRMAYVGTVTLHDDAGDSLRTLRFGCMPQSDAEALCETMANEVYVMLERQPGLSISLLADGAPEMWNLLEAAFPEELFGRVTRRIDFWHLLEKLSPAATAIFGADNTKSVLHRWRQDLRTRSSAALDILNELVDSGLERHCLGSEQPVHDAITYLRNHHKRMNYAGALRKNLPIGSGNVEATCKTLVAVRMKRCGARWKERSGEHVIRLRAIALSDRWEPAMALLHESRRTAVRRAA